MKLLIYYAITALLLSLTACDKDNEREFAMRTPSIGEVFGHHDIWIQFESADSVIYYTTDPITHHPIESQRWKGKYIFDNGNITNPLEGEVYDRTISPIPCVMALKGKFISQHVIEASSFYFLGWDLTFIGRTWFCVPGYDRHNQKYK